MEKIQTFKNEMFGEIRTMTNEKGETFFVGKDVAKALGYSNTSKAIQQHVDQEDKGTLPIRESAYETRAVVINESGLYSLILSSKLEKARLFKRWVTSEVLPQIRKTGGYIPTHDAEGRQLTDEEIVERGIAIVGNTIRMVNQQNADCITATQIAESWEMEVGSFNKLLKHMGIQYRKNGSWHLASELEGLGLAESRTFAFFSLKGAPKVRHYLVWTPKGVEFLKQRVLKGECHRTIAIQQNLFIKAS